MPPLQQCTRTRPGAPASASPRLDERAHLRADRVEPELDRVAPAHLLVRRADPRAFLVVEERDVARAGDVRARELGGRAHVDDRAALRGAEELFDRDRLDHEGSKRKGAASCRLRAWRVKTPGVRGLDRLGCRVYATEAASGRPARSRRGGSRMKIWIDADACPRPVKEVIFRAAGKRKVEAVIVANRALAAPKTPMVRAIVVADGADVADDWIAERVEPEDLVVTADIPLAARVVERGATGVNPRGETYTEANVGERLSVRDFMARPARDGGRHRRPGAVEQEGHRALRQRARPVPDQSRRI